MSDGMLTDFFMAVIAELEAGKNMLLLPGVIDS